MCVSLASTRVPMMTCCFASKVFLSRLCRLMWRDPLATMCRGPLATMCRGPLATMCRGPLATMCRGPLATMCRGRSLRCAAARSLRCAAVARLCRLMCGEACLAVRLNRIRGYALGASFAPYLCAVLWAKGRTKGVAQPVHSVAGEASLAAHQAA
jgi:hypothetical protein